MKYGIPSLMALTDAEALARFCADTGFDFVEMNMTFPWFQPDVLKAQDIRLLTERYGIGWTIHLHDSVNPFEFSPDMRKGSLENIRFALDLACELGIPRLNMHLMPGTYSSVNGKKTYLYDQCLDRYLSYVREFQALVESALKGRGILFCIENTSGYRPFQHRAIETLLESDCFGLTFDIGHNFKAGGEDEGFILSHADRLRHFHIHDCSLKSNHLGLGEGGLDVLRYLDLSARYDCTTVIEVKESAALVRSKEYLKRHHLFS